MTPASSCAENHCTKWGKVMRSLNCVSTFSRANRLVTVNSLSEERTQSCLDSLLRQFLSYLRFYFHFFHGSINLSTGFFSSLSPVSPDSSLVLLHSLLCVESKWFAFCVLFTESFSTEQASPAPEHPRTAATRHLMSYFLIGSSCSQTWWLLWAHTQLYQLWVCCSAPWSSLSLLSFVPNMPNHLNKLSRSSPEPPSQVGPRGSPWEWMPFLARWGGQRLRYEVSATCCRTVTRIVASQTEILHSDELLFPEIANTVSPYICCSTRSQASDELPRWIMKPGDCDKVTRKTSPVIFSLTETWQGMQMREKCHA